MIHTVQSKKKNEGRKPMKQPGKPARAKLEAVGRHFSLELVDDNAFKERGYNPYETVAHVKDLRSRDVWRNKPKRA